MLSLEDALKHDVLADATLVAGHAGVNKAIVWVHIMGVPDAARWLKGGEFVLTTGINMPPEPDDQEHYLLDIIHKDVTALAIAVGSYIPKIPENLRRIADAHDFPLVAVPYQAFFIDIARELNSHIARRDVKRALDIHQALTQLVLDGGGIYDLAQTLARLVHQSISIENDRFEAFASVNIAAIDEARRYTQRYGRTDSRLVQALEERGYLPHIRHTLRPVNLPKMPDVGLEMERILAPIVVHGDIYGFVWIIADDRPLTELEQMAVQSGATIAALMLLRQEAIQREASSQRGDLLASLMRADVITRKDLLTDRVLRFGVDLREPYCLVLLEGVAYSLSRQNKHIDHLIETQRWAIVAGQFAGQLVLIVQNNVDLKALDKHLRKTLDTESSSMRIGISAYHKGATTVAQAHDECREGLLIAQRLNYQQKTVYFDQLGYLHTLYRAGADTLKSSPYAEKLHRLNAYQQADLFRTLEIYLDSGGNGVAAAEMLHIHRSTLNYRLTRISEVLDADLSDPHVRTNLQMVLKLIRLFEME